MKSKRKILAILSSKVLYGKERSNIEIYNLISNLDNAELLILVNKSCDFSLKEALEGLNYKLVRYPNRIRKRNRYVGFFWDFIICNITYWRILFKYKPDLLLLNSEVNFYDLFPTFLTFKKKIVFRMGDIPSFGLLAFQWFNSFIWYNYIIKRVNVIVSISEYIQNNVERLGRKNFNDRIIYNYPPSRKNSLIKPEKHLYDQNNYDIVFGYIGQITEAKGVDKFIDAAIKICNSENKHVKFYVAGNYHYDLSFGKRILSKIDELPNDKIKFLGEVTDIHLFFNNIDVLCVPSVVEEALGNVVVEAKQNSIPCIVFPSGGMPELISHKKNGFITADKTINGLMEGMKFYLNHLIDLESHSQNSLKSMQQLGIERVIFENKWKDVLNL